MNWFRTGIALIAWFQVAMNCFAAPDTTMSFSSASSGGTITASEHNTVRNETSSKFNSHTHTDISQVATTLNIGTSSGGTSVNSAGTLVLEGATADEYETTFSVTDPTADRTITVPNSSGMILPSGSIFLMATSCPTGSTEISSTYAGLLVIGTSATTSAAAGTSQLPSHNHTQDAHTHTQNAHTHTAQTETFTGGETLLSTTTGSLDQSVQVINNATAVNQNATATNQATGSASYSTLRLCQIN